MVGKQQVGEADDRGQHVVEVVGDAAGELADGVHLLLLAELIFERPLLGDVEGVDDHRLDPAGALRDRVDVETRAAVTFRGKRGVDKLDAALPRRGSLQRGFEVRPVGFADEIDEPARTAAHDRRPEQTQERRIGATDAPGAIEGADGDRRVVEEAREPDLRGAERLRAFLPRTAIEDQRAGRTRRAVGGHRHTVEEPHRQALAILLGEVEVDDGGAVARLLVGRRRKQRDGIAADDARQRQAARFEAGEVYA